jgi:hypothetical protein
MFNLTPNEVTQYRDNLLAGEDRNLIPDVGYFLIWYSGVELGLTNLLAYACNFTDLDAFDSLVAGMDLKVKIERLRRVRKRRGGIGPMLDARLRYLDAKCRPIRNRLVHSAMSRSLKQKDAYLSSTLGTMPWDDYGEKQSSGLKHNPPVIYSPAQLLGWGAWLAAFAQDLSEALNAHLKTAGEFELVNPRTPEPPVDQGTPPPPNPRAKGDKPAQTERGKG